MTLVNELAEYLNHEGFKRFNKAWMAQYKRLGRLGGSIILKDLTPVEIEKLSLLLGMDLTEGVLRLTYTHLVKALNKTKYENISFLEVLHVINGETMISNKQIKEDNIRNKEVFIHQLKLAFYKTPAYDFLEYYLKEELNTRLIINDYTLYYDTLYNIAYAYNHFPVLENKTELLAVFAQKITKNPHYFDDEFKREILLKSIAFYLELDYKMIDSIEKNQLLLEAGIQRDELSNYCHICHLLPLDQHNTWSLFYNEYEPLTMNMYNINRIQEGFKKQDIYIFENPSVFSNICDYIRENNLDIGIVCSHGQINMTTYLLLDKLAQSECQFYYAGDFDPEGLMIADKLKTRYSDLKLFEYNVLYFSKAGTPCEISKRRLTILENITDVELLKIAEVIQEQSIVLYQEALIEEYKHKILSKSANNR